MEKKNNGGLIAIIIILLVALLGVIFYVAYDKGLIFSNDNKVEDNDVPTNEEEENNYIEKEITANDTIQKLNSMIELLAPKCNLSRGNFYEKMFASKEDKLKITFESLSDKFTELTQEEKTAQGCTEYTQCHKISADEVVAQYKQLFGEELKTFENVYNKCPSYEYNSNNNVYYRKAGGCGGTCGYTHLSYINRYMEDNNNIYVYVNIGQPDRYTANDPLYIYCDINKEKVCDQTKEDNYVINETNYQKFSEYKYTFEKNNDGTFYYKNLERIK